jgi:DNA polymerase (family X)
MGSSDDRPASARAAGALREIGGLLALEVGNRFRSQAYARAAEVVETVRDLETLASTRRLTNLPGIGKAIAGVIEELTRTGRSKLLEDLRSRYPRGSAELSQVLSLPRVRAIHGALGVSTLAELRSACEKGRVRRLPGFGEKSERRLVERIDALASRRKDVILPHAAAQGAALRGHMRRHHSVAAIELAGDLRRRRETIDRLELVVGSDDPAAVAAQAGRAPGWTTIEKQDATRFILHQAGRLDAHVRVVSPADFAVALVDATGSAAHVAKLGKLASRNGFALDHRSLRKGGRTLRIASEEALYARLGLELVPPELREDAGEIEAAASAKLPKDLVSVDDIQGAVHCHTEYSDGKNTVEQMARAAEALELRYLTITDHSASATYANGLDLDRLRRQADEIARVRERVSIRLLHGTESDILQDGALDYPMSVLKELDVVIASVHRRHKMNAKEMTARLVRALRHPLFKIWGHALGRYVLSRPPFECDMDEVLDAVAHSRAAIEVNGDPHRLDLAPPWIREAKRRNIRFVVSTDAHSTGGLHNVRWGVDMARRGWLSKGDVLNTLGPAEFAAAVHP